MTNLPGIPIGVLRSEVLEATPAELRGVVVTGTFESAVAEIGRMAGEQLLELILARNRSGNAFIVSNATLASRLGAAGVGRADRACALLRTLHLGDDQYPVSTPHSYTTIALGIFGIISRSAEDSADFYRSLSQEAAVNNAMRQRLLWADNESQEPLIKLAAKQVLDVPAWTGNGAAATLLLAEQLLDSKDQSDIWHTLDLATADNLSVEQLTQGFSGFAVPSTFADMCNGLYAKRVALARKEQESRLAFAQIQQICEDMRVRGPSLYTILTQAANLQHLEAIDPYLKEKAVYGGASHAIRAAVHKKRPAADEQFLDWVQGLGWEDGLGVYAAFAKLRQWVEAFDETRYTQGQLCNYQFTTLQDIRLALPYLEEFEWHDAMKPRYRPALLALTRTLRR